MTKASGYTRDFNQDEIKDIQAKYSTHLKRTRGGFLSMDVKKRLVHITNWEEGITNNEIYRYFYEIREHTKTALRDFQLLCDTLSEKELQLIFGTKQRQQSKEMYPVTEVLSSLLPSMTSPEILRENIKQFKGHIEAAKKDLEYLKNDPARFKEKSSWIKKNEPELKKLEKELPKQEEKLKEQEWRKFILEDVAVHVLQWYLYSGLFETDSHKRMIIDVMDAITIMSSGKKMGIRRDPDQTGIEVY